MEFGRFQDFLSGLVARQRELFFSGDGKPSIEELLEKFQTNHWPHMTGRVARMEGMLAVLLALTLAVVAKTFLE